MDNVCLYNIFVSSRVLQTVANRAISLQVYKCSGLYVLSAIIKPFIFAIISFLQNYLRITIKFHSIDGFVKIVCKICI